MNAWAKEAYLLEFLNIDVQLISKLSLGLRKSRDLCTERSGFHCLCLGPLSLVFGSSQAELDVTLLGTHQRMEV